MKKLKRLPKRYTFDKKGYTTGDDQRWTYEYTWEDFDAFIRVHREKVWVLPGHFSICIPIPEYPILKYFQEHPEKLLESKIVQEESIPLDEIKVSVALRARCRERCFSQQPCAELRAISTV